MLHGKPQRSVSTGAESRDRGAGETRRKRAAPLLAVLIACGGTIAVLDSVLRLWLNDSVYQIALPELPELSRFTSDTFEDRMRIGNLGEGTADRNDDVPRRVRTTIDSYGFRNDRGADDRPLDLVVLGDSFGFGVGTTQEKTFGSLLRDHRRWSMYNLSMPYSGPWAGFVNLSLESKHLTMRPGAVVLWAIFSANDLDDRYGGLDVQRLPWRGAVARTWLRVKRVRNRSPMYQMLQRAKNGIFGEVPDSIVSVPFLNGRPVLFVREYSDLRRRTADDIVSHVNYPALLDTVAATKKLTDTMGVSLKMVFIPSKEDVYGWLIDRAEPWSTRAVPTPFGTALSQICAKQGIPYLDLTPPFVLASRGEYEKSGEMLWWYDDTHWNERGHQLAASAISERLLATEK